MIADPDAPGYRYPDPGERLWHEPWGCWIVVIEADENQRYGLRILDEVAGTVDSAPAPREGCGGGDIRIGASVQVKLRSLRAEPDRRGRDGVDGGAGILGPDGVTGPLA